MIGCEEAFATITGCKRCEVLRSRCAGGGGRSEDDVAGHRFGRGQTREFILKLSIGSAVFAIAMVSAQAFGQSGALDPAGTWLTEDGRAKIRLEHCGEGNEKLCGFVAWMKDALNDKGQPRTDLKNPDPAKRSRPSLGLQIMAGLKPEDPTHFAGEIYNADDGKMYAVTVAIEKPAEVEIRGCLLRFLCGSQTWARVADIAAPATTKLVSSAPAGKAAKLPASGRPHDNQPAAQ